MLTWNISLPTVFSVNSHHASSTLLDRLVANIEKAACSCQSSSVVLLSVRRTAGNERVKGKKIKVLPYSLPPLGVELIPVYMQSARR